MLVVSPFYSVIWIINLVVGKEFMKKKKEMLFQPHLLMGMADILMS